MLGCYRRKLKIGGKSFHLPISLIFHFKYKSECRKKTKSSLEEVRFFPLIDYPLQYMEMPLPSYLFTYISFK